MIETVSYLGLPHCQKLSNGTVEVVVTTDVGPRILRYALPGAENILGELPDPVMKTELGDWKPWGGHRLWTAPEGMPRSYAPDNSPIQFRRKGDLGLRLIQPVEPTTGIRKEMTVTLEKEGSGVTIHHKITNQGLWPIDVAPWALTIMNGGGRVLIPQEPYLSHDDYLLPARPMVLWHYTDLSDRRFTLGKKFLQLCTDETLAEPQKIGVANKQGWAAYARKKTLFLKRFPYVAGATYPDGGCNCEAYTAATFIELETLAPMRRLEPGASAEHVERWSLFGSVDLGKTEASLEAALRPLLEKQG